MAMDVRHQISEDRLDAAQGLPQACSHKRAPFLLCFAFALGLGLLERPLCGTLNLTAQE